METLRCKNCGALISAAQVQSGVLICAYCGSAQRLLSPASPDGREAAYQSALSLLESASHEEEFRQAAKQFSILLGYKDAADLYERCLAQETAARNERIYQSAVEFSNGGYYEATERAISLFQDIPGYKDADARLQGLRERISGEIRVDEEISKAMEHQRKKKLLTVFMVYVVLPIALGMIIYLIWLALGNH